MIKSVIFTSFYILLCYEQARNERGTSEERARNERGTSKERARNEQGTSEKRVKNEQGTSKERAWNERGTSKASKQFKQAVNNNNIVRLTFHVVFCLLYLCLHVLLTF